MLPDNQIPANQRPAFRFSSDEKILDTPLVMTLSEGKGPWLTFRIQISLIFDYCKQDKYMLVLVYREITVSTCHNSEWQVT